MRFFSLHDLQYWFLAFFLGIVSVIVVYVAWAAYPRRRTSRSDEELREAEGHEIQGGHKSEDNPAAPFLVFTYIIVVLWGLAYFFFRGVLGGPIG